MSYRIGLKGRAERCPVCDLSPRAFRDTTEVGVVECARCGVPANVHEGADGEKWAAEATHIGMLELFATYWRETGHKISAPQLGALDLERRDRCERFDLWCQGHPEAVLRARLATAAPYATVVVICAEHVPGDPSTRSWQRLLPGSGAGRAIGIPISAAPFVPGTIVTISSPNDPPPPISSVEKPPPGPPNGKQARFRKAVR